YLETPVIQLLEFQLCMAANRLGIFSRTCHNWFGSAAYSSRCLANRWRCLSWSYKRLQHQGLALSSLYCSERRYLLCRVPKIIFSNTGYWDSSCFLDVASSI